jgi:hypothetical protein
MAVTRKPKAKQEPQAVDVDALIRKGGSVAGEAEPETAKPQKNTSVILRVPNDIIERVDEAVGARRIKTPRHTWLLEAIIEKLDRESQGNQ